MSSFFFFFGCIFFIDVFIKQRPGPDQIVNIRIMNGMLFLYACEDRWIYIYLLLFMTNLVLDTNQFDRIHHYANYIHRMGTFVTH